MTTEKQQQIIEFLDQNYPHWKKWYRHESSPFNIQEREMIQTLFEEKQPLKALQQKRLVAPITIKRNMDSFWEKLMKPKTVDNYEVYVASRIDTVNIPLQEYEKFKAWHNAAQKRILAKLEKKMFRDKLKEMNEVVTVHNGVIQKKDAGAVTK